MKDVERGLWKLSEARRKGDAVERLAHELGVIVLATCVADFPAAVTSHICAPERGFANTPAIAMNIGGSFGTLALQYAKSAGEDLPEVMDLILEGFRLVIEGRSNGMTTLPAPNRSDPREEAA